MSHWAATYVKRRWPCLMTKAAFYSETYLRLIRTWASDFRGVDSEFIHLEPGQAGSIPAVTTRPPSAGVPRGSGLCSTVRTLGGLN